MVLKKYKIFFLFLMLCGITSAQYFGRNKPGYKVFDYKVLSTPNFTLHHYFKNDSIIYDIAAKSEQWYRLHQYFFQDTLYFKNPIIIYQNHGDFQQTNISNNAITIGLGGFTEGLKNRVVIPVSQTSAQTDHVLGHELVHAFQYNYLLNKSGLAIQDLGNIPLWMIEGMAEYLSVGHINPHAAMWLRDDLLHHNFPTLYEMSRSPKYDPYKYGLIFWSFLAENYGDQYFGPLLAKTARVGYKKAIEGEFKVNVSDPIEEKKIKKNELAEKKARDKNKKKKRNKKQRKRKKIEDTFNNNLPNFDSLWHSTLTDYYFNLMHDTIDSVIGVKLFDNENAGNYNLSPVISPNGKYIIFMSEKELFSIDLFLADVRSGKIFGRFDKRVNENEIDAFNFIESTGTWSPDSKYFAYSVYKKGINIILIIDVESKKVIQEISPSGISAISNPSWSPDNNYIAFSAQHEGITDIYIYNLNNNSVKKITKNGKCNIQPAWSFDSKKITFITEALISDTSLSKIEYEKNIAVYDLLKDSIKIYNVFSGAINLNPLFSPDNESIYFLSDRDGFRNLYRYSLAEKKVYQQTDYLTGISGITVYSPAISIAKDSVIVYSYYSKHRYEIYKANLTQFKEFEVNQNDVNFLAANLAPVKHEQKSIVYNKLISRPIPSKQNNKWFIDMPYRPRFQLDYITNINVGVSTGLIGPGAAGGSSAIFSDIVGNNQLFVNLNINGTIYDFGGVVAYMNHKNRVNYGIAISHIPYYFGYQGREDSISLDNGAEGYNEYLNIYRIFESKAVLFSFYPISTTMRFEGGISANRYGYKLDRYSYYYKYPDSLDHRAKEELDAPNPIRFFSTDIAFVIDNSNFGLTAPLKGTRTRIQVSKNFGDYDYYTALFDFRKYFFSKPIGFAFRYLNHIRIGSSSDKDSYNSLYLGYPWYIRGYQSDNFNTESQIEQDLSINKLAGSKMIVTNAEIRIPFTGPKQLSLINSRFLITDLNFFVDAGIIWDNNSKVVFNWSYTKINERFPLVSAGVSLRINVFGYMVLEPFYAFPFQLIDGKKGVLGLNFVPGW